MFNFVRMIRTHSKFPLQSLPSATRKAHKLLGFTLRPFYSWPLSTFLMCPLLLPGVYPSLQSDYNCLNIPCNVIPLCFCTSCSLSLDPPPFFFFFYLPSEYLLKFQDYSTTPSFLKTPLRSN